jgi:predicted component of type VI protein secretion system
MKKSRDLPLDGSQPALIVTYGATGRKYRVLDREVLVLGSGRGCDLGLASPEIAPVHCVIGRGPNGWYIRDCGSRVGTHVNGELVHESPLQDGDTVQLGPFCFRAHLPAGACALPAPTGSDPTLRHLRQSRHNLALIALALRRRLREERVRHQEQQRECEERTLRLDQVERDLAVDREILEEEFQALKERVLRAEQELARREAEVDEELRARWQQFHQLRHRAEEDPGARRGSPVGTSPELGAEARRLDLRRQELAHYASHLQQLRRRLELDKQRGVDPDPRPPQPRETSARSSPAGPHRGMPALAADGR